jgi:hypothetical protein
MGKTHCLQTLANLSLETRIFLQSQQLPVEIWKGKTGDSLRASARGWGIHKVPLRSESAENEVASRVLLQRTLKELDSRWPQWNCVMKSRSGSGMVYLVSPGAFLFSTGNAIEGFPESMDSEGLPGFALRFSTLPEPYSAAITCTGSKT